MKPATYDDKLNDDAMIGIAANGARALDERELELALRHSLRSPTKKYKTGHFAALARRKKSV